MARRTIRLALLGLFLFHPSATDAATAVVGSNGIQLTATDFGISAANLSDTPVSSAIDMENTVASNQLSLTISITPGTTTSITVRCSDSVDNSSNSYSQIGICDGNASATCAPDIRTYAMSDYTTQTGKKIISSNWRTKKRYVKCTLDDAADGTGTVTVTGTRSWQ